MTKMNGTIGMVILLMPQTKGMDFGGVPQRRHNTRDAAHGTVEKIDAGKCTL